MADSLYQPPALIALAEIESKPVLEDLITKTVLRKWPYQLVHYDSPDRRGIDLALLYNKAAFKLKHSEAIPYKCADFPHYKSRDMLHVQLEAKDGSLLNMIVCHWPSRFGGKQASSPKRSCAAHVLTNYAQNLPGALIVLGDFNDVPQDQSLLWLSLPEGPLGLINLMADAPSYSGSHRYQGEWAYLDQILVDSTHYEKVKEYGVFRPAFLLEAETKYPGYKPKRAFQGNFYRDGFSDHLPIYLDWEL